MASRSRLFDQIAFIRSREGASSSGPLRGEILDVGVGGTKARRVTAEGLDLEGLTWSPDGGQLAYSREVDGYTPQVFVVPNGSGCERLLTTKFPKGSASPAWSPIDRVVAFTAKWTSSAADYSIYTVRDDGASSAV